jgi:hypothetical protein
VPAGYQAPRVAVSVRPPTRLPEIVGAAVLTGVAAITGPTPSASAVPLPARLVATTWTRNRAPTSAGAKV